MSVTYYKATFGNGQVRTRSTETRVYKYAYLAVGAASDGRTWSVGGWSSSETLARKALNNEINARLKPYYHSPDYYGVVPAIPIGKHEFINLKVPPARGRS